MEWRWSNITDRVIVRKEIICNIFCKEYSKRNVSEKPYSDIADIIEKPFEPVKVKINGLRAQFGRGIDKENKQKWAGLWWAMAFVLAFRVLLWLCFHHLLDVA